MREPNRIDIILKRLEKVWKKYPDLRLSQLIVNVYSSDLNYYIEDEDFIENIEEYYKL